MTKDIVTIQINGETVATGYKEATIWLTKRMAAFESNLEAYELVNLLTIPLATLAVIIPEAKNHIIEYLENDIRNMKLAIEKIANNSTDDKAN